MYFYEREKNIRLSLLRVLLKHAQAKLIERWEQQRESLSNRISWRPPITMSRTQESVNEEWESSIGVTHSEVRFPSVLVQITILTTTTTTTTIALTYRCGRSLTDDTDFRRILKARVP
ncbi:unnamed protein product [Didymodactylos carnosus]|uniref:Uncharacterized protein n=1 Tax=Didymodactylos carnosus TaxID=1234261 RepID=A0A8S2M485_9BILA|nr:unnamed protein product [Didymodactylos carnosus]CAF3923251.1 unnamed protein product [Didymodactylos carnosus]